MMQNLKSETGRSMVEMLGVLAVIGVLSVGGIAGYNAAMDRMTLNKVLSLIDTVSMAVAVESGSDNEESFYRKPGLTEMERSKLFCNSYGAEWCANGTVGSDYYLAKAESGSHVLNGTRKPSAMVWKLSRNDSAPDDCYCESDVSLVIGNIKSITCDQIIDNLADKYQDVLSGFSGANHATLDLDSSVIHKTICESSERVYDSTQNVEPYKDTAIQLVLVFKGADGSNCGRCKPARCPC